MGVTSFDIRRIIGRRKRDGRASHEETRQAVWLCAMIDSVDDRPRSRCRRSSGLIFFLVVDRTAISILHKTDANVLLLCYRHLGNMTRPPRSCPINMPPK